MIKHFYGSGIKKLSFFCCNNSVSNYVIYQFQH